MKPLDSRTGAGQAGLSGGGKPKRDAMTLDWNLDGRVVVNWKTCDWQPFPALWGRRDRPDVAPVRAVSGCGDGTYLMKVAPGGGAGLHAHAGRESFVVLEGALVDGDGTVLVEGDVVTYDPGTRHRTDSPEGCTLMVWNEAPVDVVDGDEEVGAMKAGAQDCQLEDDRLRTLPQPARDRRSDRLVQRPRRPGDGPGPVAHQIRAGRQFQVPRAQGLGGVHRAGWNGHRPRRHDLPHRRRGEPAPRQRPRLPLRHRLHRRRHDREAAHEAGIGSVWRKDRKSRKPSARTRMMRVPGPTTLPVRPPPRRTREARVNSPRMEATRPR